MNPKDRITKYLFSRKSSMPFSTLDGVVQDVKRSVFLGKSPIPDEEIRKIVSQWALIHAAGLLLSPSLTDAPAATPAGSYTPPSESELIDAVKKAVTAISNGVTIGKKGANINLGVTGATANLKSGDLSASLGISWTGTLKLETASGPFHFQGSLAKDEWELVLSFPQDTYIPNLATLGKVFTEGERGLRQMAAATRQFKNVEDAKKVGALIKPHVSAVQDAADAVSGLAKASKKGGASFGFKIGSPNPAPGEEGMPKGVQGMVVFTYVF